MVGGLLGDGLLVVVVDGLEVDDEPDEWVDVLLELLDVVLGRCERVELEVLLAVWRPVPPCVDELGEELLEPPADVVLELVLDVVEVLVGDVTRLVDVTVVVRVLTGLVCVAAGVPPSSHPSKLLANSVAPISAPAPTTEAATTPINARRRERSASSLIAESSRASSCQYGSSSTIAVDSTDA